RQYLKYVAVDPSLERLSHLKPLIPQHFREFFITPDLIPKPISITWAVRFAISVINTTNDKKFIGRLYIGRLVYFLLVEEPSWPSTIASSIARRRRPESMSSA
uniref:Uncharacterized protein n=1 Tax=Romanomermis culicivorax TaxID=13658 RepID=A0A915KL24_ROMCU